MSLARIPVEFIGEEISIPTKQVNIPPSKITQYHDPLFSPDSPYYTATKPKS